MALSRNTIKWVRSLHQKKFRQKYNKFIAEGDKIVRELLVQDRFPVVELYALPDWLSAYSAGLPDLSFAPQVVNEKELGQISQLRSPNQVLAVVDTPPWPTPDYSSAWGLYLDGIQDPGNLGAILRIADWFAFDYVIGGPGTVEPFNSKVIQASMGAFLRVVFLETTLDAIRRAAPDLPFLAATMDGASVFSTELPRHGLLLVGNEGNGLGTESLSLATHRIGIPRAQGGGAESLNASVATGILAAVISNRLS